MTYRFVTSKKRSRVMRSIRSCDTGPEVEMRKMLWNNGLRYRKNDSALPGKPDIAITKHKIAVFVDGEFWHGFQWSTKRERIAANREYWIPKIERTIERDNRNNELLAKLGWTVIRYWESDVRSNRQGCLENIMMLVQESEMKSRQRVAINKAETREGR